MAARARAWGAGLGAGRLASAPFRCGGSCRAFAAGFETMSSTGNMQKARGGNRAFNPRVDTSPGARARVERSMPSVTPHHTALQSLANSLSPFGAGEGKGASLGQALRERRTRIRARNDYQQQADIFEESRLYLMEPEFWTFGHFAAYQRKLLDLMGAYGWRRRLSSDDPSIQHLEKELRVLDAMTPIELASNHKRVFTREAKKLIAEKAGATEKYVDQVLLEHDILRGDRRWYMIREQFGKPLPKTFEDRQIMAEYDRPFSEMEKEMRQEMIDKEEVKMNVKGKKPPRINKVYFRHPTRGGNRWSTRPPKWYPSRWRLRPERRFRLRGVGVGRGGDRGRPWGRIAAARK